MRSRSGPKTSTLGARSAVSASGGNSTTLTTIRAWPASTAASTANVEASGSNGTPIVASRTGRPGGARTPSVTRDAAEEPSRQHDGQEHEEGLRDEERQEAEDDGESEGDPDYRHAHPPHVAHDPPVFLGRDLRGVPAPPAGLARPGLAVGDVLHLAAVARNRDWGRTHTQILRARLKLSARGGTVPPPSKLLRSLGQKED